MIRFASNQVWASLAVAAAATLGAVGPAQAKVYTGQWDPAYGGIFGNLGWKGSVQVSAPAACKGVTGFFANSDPGCGGGAMTLLGATVQFYDMADPSTVLQTLVFNPGSTSVSAMTLQYVGPQPKNTDLLGLETGFFAPIKGTIPQAQYGGSDYFWHLGFTGNKVLLAYTKNAATSPLCGYFGNSSTCGLQDYANYPATVTYVPEPETYALMLAGLGAIGFVARRRRAAQVAASASA